MTQTINASRWRHWHRWLALLVGLQMVVWGVSGAYMVLFKLPFIHGNHLVHATSAPLPADTAWSNFHVVSERYPRATEINLTTLWVDGAYQPVYQIVRRGQRQLLHGETLAPIQLNAAAINAIARQTYALGDAPIVDVALLTDTAPSEITRKLLPVWQVQFDDSGATNLYFSAATGELVSKRHTYWRGFDIMWMLHIMDYDTRSDIETWWLRSFIIGNIAFWITGVFLIAVTIFRRQAVRRQS